MIRGYHADIDPAALGLKTAAIIVLQVTQGHPVEETMAALFALPQVRSGGPTDWTVGLAGGSPGA